jgi:hypothetical protein
MIIHADIKDKEHIEKVCAILDYSYRFFTNETNDTMLMAEVEWSKGVDLTAAHAYHFGRMVETYSIEVIMKKLITDL